MERAVVLLSGGLDSTTSACWALREGYAVTALSLDYGQRQRVELERARAVAQRLGVALREVRVDLGGLAGSALTDPGVAVPKGRPHEAIGAGVPVTYVPARNTLLLSLALGLAEVEGATALVIGANAVDYSGYPDCRGAFLEAFEALAAVATRAAVEDGVRFRVLAPLLELSKAQIVALAVDLEAPLALTWSCYDPAPAERACGQCDACVLRLQGFAAAGVPDPIPYAGGAT